jgi:hypothetical protein
MILAISCSVSSNSASTVTVSTPLSFPPTAVGPLPLLSELSQLTRVFFSETVVGILGAVFTLFRVTASEARVFSAVWLAAGGMVAAVVVGAGNVEDVMTPVVVAEGAVVFLAVAATAGASVLAFAVVATTVVAVAAGVAVAGAGAVGSEEGLPVTVAVSSSRLSTPALFRYAWNINKLVISAYNTLYDFVLR